METVLLGFIVALLFALLMLGIAAYSCMQSMHNEFELLLDWIFDD